MSSYLVDYIAQPSTGDIRDKAEDNPLEKTAGDNNNTEPTTWLFVVR